MAYLYLGIAIVAQVAGTTALKSEVGFTKLGPPWSWCDRLLLPHSYTSDNPSRNCLRDLGWWTAAEIQPLPPDLRFLGPARV